MHQKFSKRVEEVVAEAKSLAFDADQEYLGTEHVLLAIMNEGTGHGSAILRSFGLDPYKLKAAVDKLVKKNMDDTFVFGDLPGSPHLKATVASAINIAQQIEAAEVCTEHLVLAMLREKGSVAERALCELDVSYDKAFAKLQELLV